MLLLRIYHFAAVTAKFPPLWENKGLLYSILYWSNNRSTYLHLCNITDSIFSLLSILLPSLSVASSPAGLIIVTLFLFVSPISPHINSNSSRTLQENTLPQFLSSFTGCPRELSSSELKWSRLNPHLCDRIRIATPSLSRRRSVSRPSCSFCQACHLGEQSFQSLTSSCHQKYWFSSFI